MTFSLRGWVVAAVIVSFAAGGPSVAALPTGAPFAVESAVTVPLDQATAVSIVGIRGFLSIATRETRELRVVSRAPGPAGAELPVGVWRDDGRLIVAPAPGAPDGTRRIDIEVPQGVALAIEAADSDVVIKSQGGSVKLVGNKMRATVQAVDGSLVAELVAGTLTVSDLKDANVRLRGTIATISHVSGNVTARAAGGSLKVAAVGGSTDVEGRHTTLAFDGLSGWLKITAQTSDVTVTGIKAGADFALVGTPLRMTGGAGDIAVTSNAPVVFQSMEASMRLEMDGGSLNGNTNKGDLELSGRNTEVNLESIEGVLHIQGDGLGARLVDVRGEIQVEATLSDILVDRAGDVVLKVDSGSVSVRQAAGTVKANVTAGNVHILEGMGPVTLEMDGGDGEVSWATISGQTDSTLTNAGGKLTVRFSASGGCRVEAKSTYGRIDNELENVKVSEDYSTARGPVNSGEHPYVRITASGDIRLENEKKAR